MTDTTTTTTGTPTTDAGTTGTAVVVDTPIVDTTKATTTDPVKDAAGDKPVAPETYAFVMPDGMELDGDSASEFSVIAKELGLTQEQAQKAADVMVNQAKRQAETHAKLVSTWVETIKADKEIGGDKFGENMAVARSALDAFGTPELKDVLNATGFGNHPAIIRAFYKIGKAISDDGLVKGSPPGPVTDLASRMFPTTPSN